MVTFDRRSFLLVSVESVVVVVVVDVVDVVFVVVDDVVVVDVGCSSSLFAAESASVADAPRLNAS